MSMSREPHKACPTPFDFRHFRELLQLNGPSALRFHSGILGTPAEERKQQPQCTEAMWASMRGSSLPDLWQHAMAPCYRSATLKQANATQQRLVLPITTRPRAEATGGHTSPKPELRFPAP